MDFDDGPARRLIAPLSRAPAGVRGVAAYNCIPMSQVTRCPSCGTRFKVVADQLRISQGWVRCGMCQAVFDASENLQSVPDELLHAEAAKHPSVPAEVPVRAAAEEVAPAVEAQFGAPSLEAVGSIPAKTVADFDSNSEPMAFTSVEEAEQIAEAQEEVEEKASPSTPEPSFADQAKPWVESEDEAAQREPLLAHVSHVSAPFDEGESLPSQQAQQVEAEGGDKLELAAGDEPGFVRQARRKAFWHSAGMRVVLVLGSLLAVAGVAGQYAWQQRDALAAQYPALAPTLEQACRLAGCELQARREIADVVISGSGFKQLADGHQYQWSLTLENRSDVTVATPMAELTLTDAQDKPLLRRVIDLKPLGAPPHLQAREEWSVNVPVQVQDLGAAVAGYRALVFYP